MTIGIPSFVLAFTPNRDPVAPGMVARVLRFSIPAGAIATACSFGSYWVAQTYVDSTLEEDRTTATISLFIVALAVLTAVARPLVPWKVGLIAAMAGLFVLCLSVPFAQEFLALEPGEIQDSFFMLLVSAAGAIAVIIIGAHTIPSFCPQQLIVVMRFLRTGCVLRAGQHFHDRLSHVGQLNGVQ